MSRTCTSADYFTTGTAARTSNGFTMACWMFPSAATQPMYGITISNSTGSSDFCGLQLAGQEAGDPLRAFHFTGGSNIAVTGNAFTASAWNHALAIYPTSGSFRVVLNGDWANSGTATPGGTPSGWNTTRIGAVDLTSDLFNGSNCDVAFATIWNAELSQAEVEALADGESPINIQPGNIEHYWLLTTGTSSTDAKDIVGGLTLTQISNPVLAANPALAHPRGRQLWFPPAAAGGTIAPIHYHHRHHNRAA